MLSSSPASPSWVITKRPLQVALSGKANAELGALAREMFLRWVRRDWQFQIGHLPIEHNTVADYLSRLAQPGAPTAPLPELEGAAEVPIPDLASLWVLRKVFATVPTSLPGCRLMR